MSEASYPGSDASEGLVARLVHIGETAPEDGISLGEFIEALGERAFGVMLFALAIPVTIPFLYVIPQIVSVPMAALAFQMAAGRNEPWFPEKFRARQMTRDGLVRMGRTASKWFGWMERLARPRLLFLSGHIGERVVGAVFCLFCVSILTPLPLTNSTPGIAVAIGSLGLITRDGLLILLGLLLGIVWIAILVIGGPALIYALIEWGRGIVSGG
ncbi:exopolysaccharide biosynthesis protein [Hyphobacterium sp. HN65]|uniref:Exopolysaccharide biosynthesis protein n=1 Tax=Hyphobacterium lacteum TaxID=3116575 RepID=A0ABU7LQ46_9PROT|nr:exopolysaccharide biosynthesis protein [Hyphobacterium sp. HN65]MEE2526022.1 exopolysaccharide biosynthesis protein [Hyphobacterium sp. HN65]